MTAQFTGEHSILTFQELIMSSEKRFFFLREIMLQKLLQYVMKMGVGEFFLSTSLFG